MMPEAPHPAAPTVFISSTVADLGDLRSALGYTLRALGANVSLSECADFDIRGDRSALDECYENVRSSGHYILVIGGSRGSLLPEGVSVTRQEYRVARETFISKRRPIMQLYLRREAEVALTGDTATQLAAGIDDPEHLSSFITEVRNPAIEGVPNFLTRFQTFDELVDSVRGCLNLGRSLSETLTRYALVSELASNLALILHRTGTSAVPYHRTMKKAREEIPLGAKEVLGTVDISADHARGLVMALIGRRRGANFSTRATEEATARGVFLTFNASDASVSETPIHRMLEQVQSDVAVLRAMDTPTGAPQWDLALLGDIEPQVKAGRSTLTISGLEVASALKYFDAIESVFVRHLALCRFLLGVTSDLESCAAKPITPLGEHEEKRLRAEMVSAEEVTRLVQNDIWPLGARIPSEIYGKTRDEQVRKVAEDMEGTLVSLGLDPAQFSEGTKRAAENYLEDFAASPDEGIENLEA